MNFLMFTTGLIVALFLIGILVFRTVAITEKIEETNSIKEAIFVIFKTKKVVDWVIMPIIIILLISVFILFLGIEVAEKIAKD